MAAGAPEFPGQRWEWPLGRESGREEGSEGLDLNGAHYLALVLMGPYTQRTNTHSGNECKHVVVVVFFNITYLKGAGLVKRLRERLKELFLFTGKVVLQMAVGPACVLVYVSFARNTPFLAFPVCPPTQHMSSSHSLSFHPSPHS